MDVKDIKVDMMVLFDPDAIRGGKRIPREECDPDRTCPGRVIKVDVDTGLVRVEWRCPKDKSSSGQYWYYAEQCMPVSCGGF